MGAVMINRKKRYMLAGIKRTSTRDTCGSDAWFKTMGLVDRISPTNEKEQLILSNLRLVPFFTKHFFSLGQRLGFEIEDILQEGTIGLMGAAETYDPSKGAFPTYARNKIEWRILAVLKSRAARRTNEDSIDSVEDIETKCADEGERRVLLNSLASQVSERTARILKAILDGEKQVDIGTKEKISHQMVSLVIREVEHEIEWRHRREQRKRFLQGSQKFSSSEREGSEHAGVLQLKPKRIMCRTIIYDIRKIPKTIESPKMVLGILLEGNAEGIVQLFHDHFGPISCSEIANAVRMEETRVRIKNIRGSPYWVWRYLGGGKVVYIGSPTTIDPHLILSEKAEQIEHLE